jgi:hypothetical protein
MDTDGCVFAAELDEGSTSVGLAWPGDYGARIAADGLVEIVDRQGRVVLREGQAFQAGGGLGPDEPAPWDTAHERHEHGRKVFCIQTAISPIGAP